MVATSVLGIRRYARHLPGALRCPIRRSGIGGELVTNRDDKIDVCVLAGWLGLGDAIFFLMMCVDGSG